MKTRPNFDALYHGKGFQLRSPVSAIHACVLLHIGDAHFLIFFITSATFFCLARLFFVGATFSSLARLFFVGATFSSLARLFFVWRDFFFWRDFFLFGATFFRWRDFFSLARLFFVSLALICRPLLDLLRAQVTNTCSCEQDGGLGGLRSKEGK